MFISYAQNFEDVMLWRALGHVERGFYIDIGAQHPVTDSVSKAFYEHGWRGVHIEPVPEWIALLRQDRPDEIVIEAAIGDYNGILELSVIPDTGLTTALTEYAQRHQAEGGYAYSVIRVPCLTLDNVLRDIAAGKEVHWLKIDVEGFERQVLSGWDPSACRPWIIVVEATIPLSQEPDFESWEPFLTEADYHFSYFDGLNRFYIAKEHQELASAFSYPPCVFDNFKIASQITHEARARQAEAQAQTAEARAQQAEAQAQTAEVKVQQAEAQAQTAEARARQAEAKAQTAKARAQQAEARAQTAEARANQAEASALKARDEYASALSDIAALHASTSWRITRPLRALSRLARGHAGLALIEIGIPRGRVERLAAVLMRRTVPQIPLSQTSVSRDQFSGCAHLTPHANHIYNDLKTAIKDRQKE
jgi:FkbM family methyltransferase